MSSMFIGQSRESLSGLTPEALAACARLSPAMHGPERLCIASWPDGVLAIVPERTSVEMMLRAYAGGWLLDKMREERVPPWRRDNSIKWRRSHGA